MSLPVAVVVCARESTDELRATWLSLLGQDGIETAELILADGSARGDLDPGGAAGQFSRVHLPGASMPVLKGEAMRAARGEVIAILDPSGAAEPGWLAAAQAACAGRVAAAGGEVLFAAEPTSINQAAYLFEYGAFAPPLPGGATAADLPGNNVAYRRAELLAAAAPVLASGFWKPFCHERLRAAGLTLAIEPAMRVRYHARNLTAAFCVRRFHYARCFGAMRQAGSPLARRWLYAMFTPLVPLILFARHVKRSLGHAGRRRLLPRALPALWLICAAWGIGEWIGCWFGAGRSCSEVY